MHIQGIAVGVTRSTLELMTAQKLVKGGEDDSAELIVTPSKSHMAKKSLMGVISVINQLHSNMPAQYCEKNRQLWGTAFP